MYILCIGHIGGHIILSTSSSDVGYTDNDIMKMASVYGTLDVIVKNQTSVVGKGQLPSKLNCNILHFRKCYA